MIPVILSSQELRVILSNARELLRMPRPEARLAQRQPGGDHVAFVAPSAAHHVADGLAVLQKGLLGIS